VSGPWTLPDTGIVRDRPESHWQGHEDVATGGLLAGFAPMMVLDSALRP
jgi:hypothetical protein